MQRTIIVGDIHGCLEELEGLLQAVGFRSQQDHLISVGDVINKGPHSLEVLQLLEKLDATVVLGNHERGFLYYLDTGRYAKACEQLHQQLQPQLPYWADWLRQLPPFYETPEYLVVHAGVAPKWPVHKTSKQVLTLIRTWDGNGKDLQNPENPPWFEHYHGNKPIIFGHWAQRGLVIRRNAIGLDTGCVYGRQLSALVLPEKRIYQFSKESLEIQDAHLCVFQ